MHMHRDPQTMQAQTMQGDVVAEVLAFLKHRAMTLSAQGVQGARMVLDPGFGFGKTVAQNFSLLARLGELLAAGYPLLAGWSRKSSLGAIGSTSLVPGAPVDSADRLIPSVAAALLAVDRGARIVRVHDVRETVQALKVLQAVNGGQAVKPGPALQALSTISTISTTGTGISP